MTLHLNLQQLKMYGSSVRYQVSACIKITQKMAKQRAFYIYTVNLEKFGLCLSTAIDKITGKALYASYITPQGHST